MDRLTVQFPLCKTPFLHVVAGFVISVLIASYGDHGEFLWKYLRIPAVADSGNSIFVGIASYVDVEVDRTLEFLFAQARDPSRVYVGLVLQEHKEKRDAFPLSRWRSHSNVRLLEIEPEASRGAGWARSKIATLHRGEKYYLQLDSYTFQNLETTIPERLNFDIVSRREILTSIWEVKKWMMFK